MDGSIASERGAVGHVLSVRTPSQLIHLDLRRIRSAPRTVRVAFCMQTRVSKVLSDNHEGRPPSTTTLPPLRPLLTTMAMTMTSINTCQVITITTTTTRTRRDGAEGGVSTAVAATTW